MHSALSCLVAAAILQSATADVALPAAFTDHMVFQRDRKIHIFGQAQPGEEVAVEIRDHKGMVLRTGRATTGQGGRFFVELLPMIASADPLTLEVRGANTIIVNDAVVGDVWIAGGQSNMEWPLGATDAQLKDGLALASDSSVRFLRTPHITAHSPAFTINASWRTLSPASAPDMGAVAFWFALALRKETQVPIGILEINWGGTRAEPWTDLATLGADPLYTNQVTELKQKIDVWNSRSKAELDATYRDEKAAFQDSVSKWWEAVNAADTGAKGGWYAKEAPSEIELWKPVQLPLRWSADPAHAAFDGVEWYRKTVEIPADWSGKECYIELGAIDDADILFLNGRALANTVADIGSPRKYRIPAGLVATGSTTIAVEVLDLHGEGGFMGSAAEMKMVCPTAPDTTLSLAGEWLARTGRTAAGVAEPPQRPSRDHAPGSGTGDPASMYHGMIAPFAGFEVRGAIWYQGESNAGSLQDAQVYRSLLPLTIRSWRAAFEQPDMPFGVVSLAAFQKFDESQPISGIWPELRDSQLAIERTSPNAGVITTIDIGDANDIHPRNKRTVGDRLARWAIATSYGKTNMAWRGPRVKNARRDADGIVVDFDVEGGRLATRDGTLPTGFAVAGADGKFVKADVVLRPPNAVKVRSAAIATPVEVRYAWQDNPVNANVIDEVSKLPAHPFRVRVEADPIRESANPPAAK